MGHSFIHRSRHLLYFMWRRLKASGFQMLTTFVLVRSTLLILLVPFDVWVSTKLMGVYGVEVIANQEILSFFSSPIGFILSLWFVSQISFAFFVEHSAITILLAKHDLGKRSILDTFSIIITRSWRVAKIVIIQSLGVTLVFSALLWCGRWIYGLMLTDWDINYYLTNQMSSLWIAVALLFILTLPLVIWVLRYWANWWLALPLSLFQNCSQWQLFQQAKRLSQAIYPHIFFGHIAWLFVRFSITLIFATTLLFTLDPLLQWTTTSPDRYPWLMLASLLLVAVTFLISFVDRFVYASSQFYVLRLQSKRLKLVEEHNRFEGLDYSVQRRTLLGVSIAIVTLLAAYQGYDDVRNFVKHLQVTSNGYVTAHRGGGYAHAENSEDGIVYSISLGVHSTEIDVQLTKDDQVIVFHDKDLGRLLGSSLVVEESTFSEIEAEYLGKGQTPPPLLTDLLTKYSHEIEFNIELKRYNNSLELANKVMDVLSNYSSPVVVSSLDAALLQKSLDLKQDSRHPHVRFALIYAANFGNSDLEHKVDMLMINEQWLTTWRLLEFQQRQQEVLVWTINSSANMQKVFLLGVDGIITDEPALAIEMINEIDEMEFSEKALLTLRHWLSI